MEVLPAGAWSVERSSWRGFDFGGEVLDLSEAQPRRTVLRVDGGAGDDTRINAMLQLEPATANPNCERPAANLRTAPALGVWPPLTPLPNDAMIA